MFFSQCDMKSSLKILFLELNEIAVMNPEVILINFKSTQGICLQLECDFVRRNVHGNFLCLSSFRVTIFFLLNIILQPLQPRCTNEKLEQVPVAIREMCEANEQ